jgi:SAM-dependent methyltransferase
MDDTSWSYFFEIYEQMPRQGPGTRESTLAALAMVPRLEAWQRILDVGCGSGTQTLDLAAATEASIVAVDIHAPFLERLARRAGALGLAGRITTELGDMGDLPYPDGSFDVIWSEGAIFIVGFARGLTSWRRLLVPGGYLVVSELCWLVDEPAPEVAAFFAAEGAEVGDLAARRRAVAGAGYELLGDFVLPAEAWWDNYYAPLGTCLQHFRARHAGDPAALEVAARSQQEIELYQRHAGEFGYGVFVMRRDGGA